MPRSRVAIDTAPRQAARACEAARRLAGGSATAEGLRRRVAGTPAHVDTTIAFVRPAPDGATEIVVNFGLLSGREATLAEVDRLARRLCDAMPEVRVHAVRTHDMDASSESVVHQVVVEAGTRPDAVEKLRAVCETWASECAEERSLEPLGG
jgi:hypothetical protein